MLLSTRLRDGGVVELPDDLLADISRLKSSEADTTTVSGVVTKDSTRAYFVGSENSTKFLGRLARDTGADGGEVVDTYMFVHVLRDIRHVQVCVALVGKLFEFGVEGLLLKVSSRAMTGFMQQ